MTSHAQANPVEAFDWADRAPPSHQTLEVRIPRREYDFFRTWNLADVESTWQREATGYTQVDQQDATRDLSKFYQQPRRYGGDVVVVAETYRPPRSGFPGRLSSPGCQGLIRALRSNFLRETADLDMNNAQSRCIVWLCRQFGIAAPLFEEYVANRDGELGMLQRIVEGVRVPKGKAKQLVIITLTSNTPIGTRCAYLHKLDVEAKQIQRALMKRPELQWILPFCKKDNVAGSFVSHLYHFIECKLLLRVQGMLVNEFRISVAALDFDGLNVDDKSWHDNQAVLDRARDVCEEVCPGINMLWAWKELDFVVESRDKVPLTNRDGSLKELRVPLERNLSRPLAGFVRVKRGREEA